MYDVLFVNKFILFPIILIASLDISYVLNVPETNKATPDFAVTVTLFK